MNKKRSKFDLFLLNNLKSTKAQAEIIVTILIILLVLAAIVIVWQVISTTVTSGAKEIPGQTDCLTAKLEIVGATSSYCINTTTQGKVSIVAAIYNRASCQALRASGADADWKLGTLTLRRGVGEGKLAGAKLLINDENNGTIDFATTPMEQIDQKKFERDMEVGQNVKVAKIIGDSVTENFRLCEPADNSIEGVIVKAG